MSAFEQRLINEINDVVRRTGAPAKTKALSARTNVPESTVRWWLRKAESAGNVARRGERGGWLPGVNFAGAGVPSRSAYLHA